MLPFLQNEAGVPQLREVEGQRAVGNTELLRNGAGRHAPVAGLNQQTEEREPVLLRKRAQSLNGVRGLH